MDRNFSVGVNSSIHTKAEDIFHRLERWSDTEFSKERVSLLRFFGIEDKGSLEWWSEPAGGCIYGVPDSGTFEPG